MGRGSLAFSRLSICWLRGDHFGLGGWMSWFLGAVDLFGLPAGWPVMPTRLPSAANSEGDSNRELKTVSCLLSES